MTLRLTLKNSPSTPLDCSGISFDRLHGLDISAVERLPLSIRDGGYAAASEIGDWFAVESDSTAGELTVCDTNSFCDYIGAENQSGSVTVDGNAGHFAATGMRGGSLRILGDAGHHLATELRGGYVTVMGNAGNSVAGPIRGGRSGMRGGSIWIRGDVGQSCGLRLRRGIVIVEGDASNRLGEDMIAGTIVLKGCPGSQLGNGMRRGTLALPGGSLDVGKGTKLCGPQFTAPLPAFPGAIDLMRRALVELQACHGCESAEIDWLSDQNWMRSVGDRSVGGLGEVVWIE